MSIFQPVPMLRLTDRIVRSGLVIACRLATSPVRTSPPLEKATTEGVVREPSALGMTTGSPASRTATTELVVPRSMPTALGMGIASVVTGMGSMERSLEPQSRIKVERAVHNFPTTGGDRVSTVVPCLLSRPLDPGPHGGSTVPMPLGSADRQRTGSAAGAPAPPTPV